MALIDKLNAIGDAIREKSGITELIPLADMPQAIKDISSEEKTVEYIESTGAQWIDTGIIPKNHRVVAKFQYTKEENKTLFGFFNNASESYHLAWYGNYWRYSCGTGSLTNVENISQCTDLQEIDFNNYDGKFLINGVECGSTNGKTTAYRTMPIFCMDHPLGKTAFCSAKLYYFKIYDRETQTLVRDFIPAIDENNVVCLYDKVTEGYFYNQGSGEFGANVIENCEHLAELETLIDESGVLDSTEGSVSEKVEQLIDKANVIGIAYSDFTAIDNKPKIADARSLEKFNFEDMTTSRGHGDFPYMFSNTLQNNQGGFNSELEYIYMPNNFKKLGFCMVANCTKLIAVYGDFSNVTEITEQTFNCCYSLRELPKMPNLIKIGRWAFGYCKELTEFRFYKKATSINSEAFTMSGVTDIYCPWAEGEVANAPWGATNATIHYNWVEGEETNAES